MFKYVLLTYILYDLTTDEQIALKQLKPDENIVILPTDKWRLTDRLEREMDALVDDEQTYEELKRDPTLATQRKLNNKLLILKKNENIDAFDAQYSTSIGSRLHWERYRYLKTTLWTYSTSA